MSKFRESLYSISPENSEKFKEQIGEICFLPLQGRDDYSDYLIYRFPKAKTELRLQEHPENSQYLVKITNTRIFFGVEGGLKKLLKKFEAKWVEGETILDELLGEFQEQDPWHNAWSQYETDLFF